jgi:3-deoxy-D-manno-octulosonic-acid transferase
LPVDERGSIYQVLDAVRPDLLLFGRGDLWPTLVLAAAERSLPVAVVGAVVRAGSRRLARVARAALGPMHRCVTWVGAASPDDADRWASLGVPPNRIAVTGDPRHDRVLQREPALGPAARLRAWATDAPVLVAGSVEPSDDVALTDALVRLTAESSAVRVVLVPHDPTPDRLAAVERRLTTRGLTLARWTGVNPPPETHATILLVTERGLLADLYLGADVAYVGGGFRRGRLHAIAEPAAFGIPVMIGPMWRGTADAEPMIAAGGAVVVDDPGALEAAAIRLLRDPAERQRRGLAARGVLRAGAAQSCAAGVLELF